MRVTAGAHFSQLYSPRTAGLPGRTTLGVWRIDANLQSSLAGHHTMVMTQRRTRWVFFFFPSVDFYSVRASTNVQAKPCNQKKAPGVSARCFFITKFGRRNWTRTNDPHHVKVVL